MPCYGIGVVATESERLYYGIREIRYGIGEAMLRNRKGYATESERLCYGIGEAMQRDDRDVIRKSESGRLRLGTGETTIRNRRDLLQYIHLGFQA